MKKALIAAFLLLTASLLAAQAPRLVIPLGHPRGVSALAFSPDGTRVLTGSVDGTAKLWDSEGREIQVFAEQGGPSLIPSGGVNDVAFSPNGAMVLTAGPGSTAKLWNLEGRVLRVLAHGARVSAVAFAPDGSAILTGGWDGTAKLWDLEGREIRAFSLDQGGAMAIWSLAFSPDGQKVLAGGGDAVEGRSGLAKLWDLAGQEIQAFAKSEGEITTVAFSPDGQAVLTGSRSANTLWRLDGQAAKVITGPTLGLALSPNGTMIATGKEDGTAQLWDLNSATLLQTFAGLREPVACVAFAPDGRTVLAGGRDGTAHLWTLDGRIMQSFAKHTSLISRVAFSPDGKAIITEREYLTETGRSKGKPLRWDLTCRDVNTLANTFDNPYGDVRLLNPSESASASENPFPGMASSPDGKTTLVGGFNGKTELRDLNGQVIQTFIGHSAYVAAVAFSPDGKMVLTGSWDGTAKLWDLTGRELATIIPLDSTDWAVTTPSGLFDASPGAMRLMHYVVGIEAIDIEQLKGRYYEPGLLPKALGLVPGSLRLTEGMGELALHPSITSASIDGHTLRVQLQARSGGIGRVALLIDENIELEANVNPQGTAAFEVDLSRFDGHFLAGKPNQLSLRTYNQEGWLKSFPHRLWYTPGGVHEKGSSRAPNTSASSTEQRLFTNNEQPTTSFAARNDEALCEITLYALIVGTSKYSGDVAALTYPDQDARAFSEALRATGEGLFCGPEKVDITLLTTSEGPMPRKAEIARAVKDIASKAQPNDILLIYLSGHGIAHPPNSEHSRFHYLTTDVTSDKLEDDYVRNHLAISQDTLMAWMQGREGIKARKRILILDACNSGQVVQTLGTGEKSLNSDQRRALEMLNDRSGMFVLAGSAADKSSYEATSYGHGLLTYSLLKSMPEVAAKNEKRVEVYELFKRAFDEVPLLAQRVGKEQKPEMIGSASFPIGRIDGDAPYPMPKALPVFLRCSFFQKGGRIRERQPLSIAADARLAELASEKKPRLAFWGDLTEFEGDHYAIDGEYSLQGDALSGTAQLYRKNDKIGEIPFAGTLDRLEEVAEIIIAKALALLPMDRQ